MHEIFWELFMIELSAVKTKIILTLKKKKLCLNNFINYISNDRQFTGLLQNLQPTFCFA